MSLRFYFLPSKCFALTPSTASVCNSYITMVHKLLHDPRAEAMPRRDGSGWQGRCICL